MSGLIINQPINLHAVSIFGKLRVISLCAVPIFNQIVSFCPVSILNQPLNISLVPIFSRFSHRPQSTFQFHHTHARLFQCCLLEQAEILPFYCILQHVPALRLQSRVHIRPVLLSQSGFHLQQVQTHKKHECQSNLLYSIQTP